MWNVQVLSGLIFNFLLGISLDNEVLPLPSVFLSVWSWSMRTLRPKCALTQQINPVRNNYLSKDFMCCQFISGLSFTKLFCFNSWLLINCWYWLVLFSTCKGKNKSFQIAYRPVSERIFQWTEERSCRCRSMHFRHEAAGCLQKCSEQTFSVVSSEQRKLWAGKKFSKGDKKNCVSVSLRSDTSVPCVWTQCGCHDSRTGEYTLQAAARCKKS